MRRDENGSAAGVTLAVVAIIVSVVALVISWMAYNRTGADLEDRIQREVNSAVENSQRAMESALEQAIDTIQEGAQEAEQEADENTTPPMISRPTPSRKGYI